MIRAVKNIYANGASDASTFYYPEVTFQWSAAKSTAKNVESGPSNFGVPTYNVIVWMKDPNVIDFTKACTGTGEELLEFVPPTTLTFPIGNSNVSYSAINPITNAGVTESNGACSGNHVYIAASGDKLNFHPVSGAKVPLPVLSGLWKLKIGGVEMASFDLAVTSPVDSDNKPKVYVPSFKATVNTTTNILSAVEFQFSMWDKATSAYIPVTDATILESSITNLNFSCDGTKQDGSRLTDREDDMAGSSVNGKYTVATTKHSWTWDTVGGDATCSPRVSYNMGGSQFNFSFE